MQETTRLDHVLFVSTSAEACRRRRRRMGGVCAPFLLSPQPAAGEILCACGVFRVQHWKAPNTQNSEVSTFLGFFLSPPSPGGNSPFPVASTCAPGAYCVRNRWRDTACRKATRREDEIV